MIDFCYIENNITDEDLISIFEAARLGLKRESIKVLMDISDEEAERLTEILENLLREDD